MKTLKTSLIVSFALFAQTAIYAQVTSAWDWPGTTSYSLFGTNGLIQNNTTAVGNYALLQSKAPVGAGSDNGHTYLNSPQMIHFRIANSEKMVLANNGNIGIGTATPSQALDVTGNIILGNPAGSSNTGILNFRRPSDGSGAVTMACVSATEFAFKQYGGSSYFTFWTTGGGTLTEKMRIDNNGNLCLGNPAGSTPGSTGILNFRRPGDGANSATMGNVSDTEFAFKQQGGSSYFTFWTPGGTGFNEKMRITYDGNVGIGTPVTNGYKLAVNGTLGARAIIVETATWSDYVFEKNYTLKTIPELEAFINTNKHLPNIPSACEVEEKGFDLATMDATLLAKIEELSLYIIEQNKKSEVQNKELKALHARIEALEKK